MLILATLVAVIAAFATSAAATDVSSDVMVITTWDAAGSPYIIKADILVHDGATLTVEPGVDVKFDGKYFLDCTGTGKIIAKGTVDEPINFTSNKTEPAAADWYYLSTGQGGALNNCTISYADKCLYAETGSTVIDCKMLGATYGIWVRGTGAYIQGANLWALTFGVQIHDATNVMVVDCWADGVQEGFTMLGSTSNSVIYRCHVASAVINCYGTTASGASNRFEDCYGAKSRVGFIALSLLSPTAAGDLKVINCTFEACSDKGIYFEDASPVSSILVKRCKAWEGSIGLYALRSGNIEITQCSFRGNFKGTLLEDCVGYTITIHQNNFIQNSLYEAETIHSEANYDKNGRGNFWWKAIYVYGFKDEDPEDGIADKQWTLTGTQKDNYPLMDPVDFEDPVANVGEDLKVRQHRSFDLDASGSTDDTWITNFTWVIELPAGDIYIYDEGKLPDGKVKGTKIDEAGVFTVTLRVTDPLGHIAYDVMELNITDADSPVFNQILTPTKVGAGNNLNFSATIEDNIEVVEVWVTYKFGLTGSNTRLDLIDQGDDLWAADISIPDDLGQKVFYSMTAKDAEGNIVRSGEREVNVVDITAPVVVPAPDYNITTGDMVWLNATVTDNRRVSNVSVEFWFGSDGEHTFANMSMMGYLWIVEVKVPRSGPSPMHLRFNATDMAGNSKVTQVLELEVLDNDAPILNLDSTLSQFHKAEKAEFRVTLSDNIEIASAFVEVKYPPEVSYESTVLSLDPESGYYTGEITVSHTGVQIYYRFRVTDGSGNELLTEDFKKYLRSQRPEIVTDPPTEAWEGQEYSVDFVAEDPDSHYYEHEWSMDTNATWLEIDIVEGIVSGTPQDYHVGWYWVNVTVKDDDDVSDWFYYEIIVFDVNAPPVVTITFPVDEQKVGNVLKASGRASDDLDNIEWVRISIDDGDWINATGTNVWSYEMPVKGMEPGTHYLQVKAFDGESESRMVEIAFIVPKQEDDESPGFGTVLAVLALAGALMATSMTARARRR